MDAGVEFCHVRSQGRELSFVCDQDVEQQHVKRHDAGRYRPTATGLEPAGYEKNVFGSPL